MTATRPREYVGYVGTVKRVGAFAACPESWKLEASLTLLAARHFTANPHRLWDFRNSHTEQQQAGQSKGPSLDMGFFSRLPDLESCPC